MKLLKEIHEISHGFKKALSFLDKWEKIKLFLSVTLMIGAGFLVNLPAVILWKFVDKILGIENPTFSIAVPFLVIIILVIILKEIFTVIRKYLVENIATQTDKKMTIRTVEHLLKTDIWWFINKHQVWALHGRIMRSIQWLIRLIKLAFLDFFPTFFSALSAIGIAFYQKPLLASFMILVIPTWLFIVIKQIASQKWIRVSLLRWKENIDWKVVEMMTWLEYIRVSNTINLEVKKIEEVTENLRKIEIKHHIHMMIYDATKYLNEAFFYILVVWIAIYFAVNGVISKWDILTYSILFMSIINPLGIIHRILDESHESTIKVNDLNNLLSEPLDKSFGTETNDIWETSNLALKISNLNFTYQEKNIQVLNNINLQVSRWEKLWIAGASWCGKSTLVKLLLRLIHGYDGKISFFGKDLNWVSRKEIAEKVVYIPQKTYIFSWTIKDNVLYWIEKKISKEAIYNALKKANIYEETVNVLWGLEGIVSENGNNLSGGQKQRIALARLILQSPDLLIFDEATSALDNTNELVIQKNIESFFTDKTIITIAHRLTTLKNSDRIIVFDKWAIVQEWTYNELSKDEWIFKNFLNPNK